MKKSQIYKSILGDTAVKFGVLGKYNYTSLKLCNKHATDSVSIDLYIHRFENQSTRTVVGTSDGNWDDIPLKDIQYYLLKGVILPVGVTLVLSEDDINFDSYKYNLYIELSASDSVVDAVLCGVEDPYFTPVGAREAGGGSNY